MIRALVVAEWQSVRAGLRALLAETPDIEVVAAIGTDGDIEARVTDTQPDVVVLDAPDSVSRAAEAAAAADAALVVLADECDPARSPLEPSVRGLARLSRHADGEMIAVAVRAAAAGLTVFGGRPEPARRAGIQPGPAPGYADSLTPREMEILQHMALGLPNKAIADRLYISVHTVKFHVASILAKLDAGSRTEAVAIGARRGLVTL